MSKRQHDRHCISWIKAYFNCLFEGREVVTFTNHRLPPWKQYDFSWD